MSLLDRLRTLSAVDCDTFDAKVVKKLGPFVDCTSNQAIAFAELSKLDANGKPVHISLILESMRDAQWLLEKLSDVLLEELVVELMMVRLSLQIAPYLSGYCHIQTNPQYSYSTAKTIKNAERIVSHFKYLSPNFPPSRICIKIPSTWEGLRACRALEQNGIATLATMLFSMEQAVLAADAGCTYIAPYVNDLRVHFDVQYSDPAPAFALCTAAQAHYRRQRGSGINLKTQVLPASLTSMAEVMALAGSDHITVPPALLEQLAATSAAGWASEDNGAAFSNEVPEGWSKAEEAQTACKVPTGDEAAWRLAFTCSGNGEAEGKLVQAINIFVRMQERLEGMVKAWERGE